MEPDKDQSAIGHERRGEVLVLALMKPERLNAWDTAMRTRLGELLAQADADPTVRAIVLTGTGERSFCAGADLKELSRNESPEQKVKQSMAAWRLFYSRILNVSKPLVAALNGLAAGSGFQVALMCDFRVAHAGVVMGQTEVLTGIPSITGSTLMMRRLGAAVATELALSGRMMDAEQAQHLGLISRLVPQGKVLDEAVELAREMGARSTEAIRQTKAWLHQSELRDLDGAFDFAEKAQVNALTHGDMA
jgi:enoyl-CoA hydratase/carnithine racemase